MYRWFVRYFSTSDLESATYVQLHFAFIFFASSTIWEENSCKIFRWERYKIWSIGVLFFRGEGIRNPMRRNAAAYINALLFTWSGRDVLSLRRKVYVLLLLLLPFRVANRQDSVFFGDPLSYLLFALLYLR